MQSICKKYFFLIKKLENQIKKREKKRKRKKKNQNNKIKQKLDI